MVPHAAPTLGWVRIPDLYAAGGDPVFSFEFFPPKTEEGERNLWTAMDALRALDPAFVSVTYGAGGSTRDKTIETVSRIRDEYELEALAHFTCVGATVDELRATLDELRACGVENVLALRGDPPRGQSEWRATEGGLSYSRELVELIRDDYDFAIGGAAFPETHIHAVSPEDDLEHLKAKVDAGAQFLITQLFFDNAVYDDFVVRAREIGIDVPIVPGVMPVTNVKQITRIAELCGSDLPAPLRSELERRADEPEAVVEFGVAYATLQCSELLAGGAPGIHFITMNRSPATRAILSALRLTRPWDREARGLAALRA